jgi:O-antigen/teichoic acid export membrane protein
MPKRLPFHDRLAIRNFLKVFFPSVLAQGLSLLLAPVLSRMYTPEDFGLAALFLGIAGLVSVLSTGKYEQAIMLPRGHRDAAQLFWLVLFLSLGTALVTLLLVGCFSTPLARLLGNRNLAPYLLVLPLGLLLHGLQQSGLFFANRTKAFGHMGRSTLVQHGSLNLVRVAAGWAQAPFNGLIAGHLAGQCLSGLYLLRGCLGKVLSEGGRPRWKAMFAQARIYQGYPRFNMPHSFAGNLSASLPVFLLTMGFSPAVAGLYAFAYTFVFRPVSLFAQSASQVLSQQLIEDYHKGLPIHPTVKKLILRLAWTGVPAFIALALWAPALFGFIFPEDYADAGRYLQVLTPALLMVFIASPLSFLPELFFRQKKAMMIDLVGLFLRFSALAAGILAGSLMLSLILLSAASTLVVLYALFWYLSLARNRPAGPASPEPSAGDRP